MKTILALSFALLAVPAVTTATAITDNLGAAFAGSAIIAARGASIGNLAAATPFNTGSDGWDLTEILLGVERSSAADSAIIKLTDSVGGFPGSTIASWTLTNLPGLFGAPSIQPSQTISGITGILLDANTEYWLAVLPGSATSEIWWRGTSVGPGNLKADSLNGGVNFGSYTFNADVAFAVRGNVQAVPEPASLLLLGSGVAALVVTAQKRRRENRQP